MSATERSTEMDVPFSSRFALGLPKPETPEEAHDSASVPGMRRAIETAARSSRLIRECLKVAETQRLGREEIYVLLAYRALVELEERHRTLERLKNEVCEYAMSTDPDGHF